MLNIFNKLKSFFIGGFAVIWVTMIAFFFAGDRSDGGAELNGFISFLLWIFFVFLIIKGKAILSGAGSVILLLVIKGMKFGAEDVQWAINGVYYIIAFGIVGLAAYGALFKGHSGSGSGSRRPERSVKQKQSAYDDSYEDYGQQQETGLTNGSDEYWTYRDQAEMYYHAFCDARTVDERRSIKRQADRLYARLCADYGKNDESVRSIYERFLDLRL